MMNWWLDRGIAGFRMDVIDLISKQPGLPDGDAFTNSVNGPRFQEWLQEMHREVFAHREGTITVGETGGLTPPVAQVITDPANAMLDMAFQFQVVAIDTGNGKWDRRPFEVGKLREVLDRWQVALADVGWNTLFWENHDQPRVVSRFGDDVNYRVESAKALATLLHLHRGTPYIFQGGELGMTNFPFRGIDDFRDVETLNHFAEVRAAGGDEEAALAGYRFFGRDNSRTPMQWDDSAQAGFTTGTPWIAVNPNYPAVNAAAAVADSDSVFAHYRELIRLRREDDVVAFGDYHLLLPDDQRVYGLARTLGAEGIVTLVNLSSESQNVRLDAEWARPDARVLLSNLADSPALAGELTLRPWEAVVYRW